MQVTKPVKKPRKQRKRLFTAPSHIRYKLMVAPLSPELVASKGAKRLPVRKGDTVRVLRGDRKGFEGKISRIDRKNYRIYIEGLTREKVDGTAIFIPVSPSKVMIRSLNLGDKWRKKIIERKKKSLEKTEKVTKKPVRDRSLIEEPSDTKDLTETKTPKKKSKTKKTEKPKATQKKKEAKPMKEKKKTKKKQQTKAKSPNAASEKTSKTDGGP